MSPYSRRGRRLNEQEEVCESKHAAQSAAGAHAATNAHAATGAHAAPILRCTRGTFPAPAGRFATRREVLRHELDALREILRNAVAATC